MTASTFTNEFKTPELKAHRAAMPIAALLLCLWQIFKATRQHVRYTLIKWDARVFVTCEGWQFSGNIMTVFNQDLTDWAAELAPLSLLVEHWARLQASLMVDRFMELAIPSSVPLGA